MDMSSNQLEFEVTRPLNPATMVPLASEADFEQFSTLLPQVALFAPTDSDSYAYINADSCPDCGGGMIRQGRCSVCPTCGFESCLI